ncbi:alpha/beta hydrolase [Streptomyces coeruleoprunus]|uniref:Alpha/beta hydrolase n=1 Tax=Streptomyces coeruleoprunus TaxID=285563 RepID=A0ABV9XH04_9ACTN
MTPDETSTPRRTRALALSLAGAALVAGTVLVPAVPAAAESPLTWEPCEGLPVVAAGQECARLSVPLDHGDPGGERLTLAVSRVRGDRPAERRGTLLLIPGGPGGSGLRMLGQKGDALRARLGGAYDLVSFDPRGVGRSSTASCGLSDDDRHLAHLRSWPAPDGDVTENVARSLRVAESCARDGGPVLRSLSTANEVRDIDALRRALGERKLSAWGVSYGAYVGAVYAQRYPRNTDRWVLDSSGDPDPARVGRGWLANMGRGVDERFPDFAAWAADPAREARGLRLAARPEEVRPRFLALAERLDRAPRETTTPGVPLTGNRLRQALQNALTNTASFPRLARLLKEAGDPDPAVRPVLTDDVAGAMPDADAAVTVGVVCNDVRWPRASAAAYGRAVAADRARHPLTAGLPVNVTPCAYWKDTPAERPTRITDQGPSNILMIQNLRDPATPYAGALKMRAALGDRARLVSVDRGGHGVYLGNGNACGDRAVTDFLRTGTRPAADVRCAD